VQPIYVSKLFDLLKFLDIEQQAVVRELGASKTQVSLWAHGIRPIAKHFAAPFVRFLALHLTERLVTEKAQSRPRGTTVLTGGTTYDTWAFQAMSLLAAWHTELLGKSGALEESLRQHVQQLHADVAQGVRKRPVNEFHEIVQRAKEIVRELRFLSYLDHRPEDRLMKQPLGPDDIDQAEYLFRLAWWAGIHGESRDTHAEHEKSNAPPAPNR